MPIRTGLRSATAAVILGVSLVGCGAATTTDGPGGDVPYVDPSAAVAAKAAADEASPKPVPTGAAQAVETGPAGPALVRDAFAGLQATLMDGCTPGDGNCAYFLGRVNEELGGLDESMKADKQGPEHFREPIAWIGTLRTTLHGDFSTANLEKHRGLLLGTRGRVNTWMQGHPEDYR
ncbi:hypothetical protein [Streptomyces sp. NPDC057428]|uniref:hypothetical protein n=1 Tax=Streptomyces sp. NPDC057428 TaxID=3346129 RepID=UPI0036C11DA0